MIYRRVIEILRAYRFLVLIFFFFDYSFSILKRDEKRIGFTMGVGVGGGLSVSNRKITREIFS